MKIINRICTGIAVRERIAQSRNRLYKVALAWACDPMLADDLVQETMTIGLQKSHQLREVDKLYPWLYSILHNCWRHYLRSRRAEPDPDTDQIPSGVSLERQVEHLQLMEAVRQALFMLPVGQREVISLVDLEGFSYAEVAEVLDIPIGTVMSRLSRARKSLQYALRRVRPADSGAQITRLRSIR